MTALELKKRFIKSKELHKVGVSGHLSSCVVNGRDSFYHIHDDEQIPENVGLSFFIEKPYQDHWRDEILFDEDSTDRGVPITLA